MDTSIPDRETAGSAAAVESGVNAPPEREHALAERTAWAEAALVAYNRHAPTALLPVPELAERVRLGVLAAEAMAQSAFSLLGDQTVHDKESADRVIGDLIAQVFRLTDDQVTAQELHQAARGLRSEAYPVKLDVLCAVAAAGAEREAAMLAALMDAAESFGCEVSGMVESARDHFEGLKSKDEEPEVTQAPEPPGAWDSAHVASLASGRVAPETT
ncbi:hypothetical protein [Streptomyces sp. NPDC059611]|uniref:hypothetical protein n=1 Tax=Streptomyces sp. NPDC059611 TaxID=3346884 RepID=UPI0036CF904F